MWSGPSCCRILISVINLLSLKGNLLSMGYGFGTVLIDRNVTVARKLDKTVFSGIDVITDLSIDVVLGLQQIPRGWELGWLESTTFPPQSFALTRSSLLWTHNEETFSFHAGASVSPEAGFRSRLPHRQRLGACGPGGRFGWLSAGASQAA